MSTQFKSIRRHTKKVAKRHGIRDNYVVHPATRRYNRDHVLPIALPSIIQGAGTILKAIAPGLSDLGKIAPGIHYRKLAAGINALRALGYSTEQMQHEPLRTMIVLIGQWNISIKRVAEHAPSLVTELVQKIGRENMPKPQGNASGYVQPADGAALESPVRAVFGSSVPPFGQPITEQDLYKNLPASYPDQSGANKTGQQLNQALIDTNPALKEQVPTGKPVQADTNIAILKPLQPMMVSTLRDKGVIAPADLESTAILFYDKVVKPSGVTQDSLDKSIVDAILTFVTSLAQRQADGEQLSGVYNQIATATNKIADKAEDTAISRGQFELGKFITDNIATILIAAAVITVVIIALTRKK